MTTFSDRLNQIISDSGLTKTAFAKRIEVSQGFVSQLCSGSFNPSPRTISAICREFNVSRDWLERGEGPMKLPEPDEDMDYLNTLLAGDDADTVNFIKKFLRVYNTLTPSDRKVIEKLIRALLDNK